MNENVSNLVGMEEQRTGANPTAAGFFTQHREASEHHSPSGPPPIFERVDGLPLRHLARWLVSWEHFRTSGNATERVVARQQVGRIAAAIERAVKNI